MLIKTYFEVSRSRPGVETEYKMCLKSSNLINQGKGESYAFSQTLVNAKQDNHGRFDQLL